MKQDDSTQALCALLSRQFKSKKKEQIYANVKDVLILLGKGALISAAFLAPQSLVISKMILDQSSDRDEWKRFNAAYLRRTLKRLESSRVVERKTINDTEILILSEHGKKKILKLSLDLITPPKPNRWDGYWHLVLYDIDRKNNHMRDAIREGLKTIGFYQIQESVFLYPYDCHEQIEILRNYYGAGFMVQYMRVASIENDSVYKSYFGLS